MWIHLDNIPIFEKKQISMCVQCRWTKCDHTENKVDNKRSRDSTKHNSKITFAQMSLKNESTTVYQLHYYIYHFTLFEPENLSVSHQILKTDGRWNMTVSPSHYFADLTGKNVNCDFFFSF